MYKGSILSMSRVAKFGTHLIMQELDKTMKIISEVVSYCSNCKFIIAICLKIYRLEDIIIGL